MAQAYVLINTEIGFENQVLKDMGNIKEVKEAHTVYGVYDIIAVVKAATTNELKGIVTHIRTVEHIVSTTILMVVK